MKRTTSTFLSKNQNFNTMRSLQLRKSIPAILLLLAAGLFSVNLNAQQLLINEFLASNGTTNTDEFGTADDWIEIYNPTGSSVNIGGYYITDDLAELNQWQIPTTNPGQTTIPAGGYLLLWADKEPEQGVLHVDIKLGSGGEDIALVQPDGVTIVDSYTFGPQAEDVSEGRTPNGGSTFDFFGEPTPSAPNNTTPGLSTVEPVIFSVRGGIFTSSQTVSLATTTGGADIHYTTDGSDPTVNDPEYTGPITISSNTPLRAKAFSPPLIDSKTSTQTYLFNISHTFPVVAYSADPDEMFDPEIGIYPNFLEDIEIVVNAELYETDGTQGFNMLFESEIQGTGSATNAQKSLALKAKSSLGGDVIPYAVFPDEDLTEYRSLTLRNNGQDWNYTHFRDAMVTSLVRRTDDVNGLIEEPIIYGQADRPSIVYINGEYWGIHNIRERMDKRYIKNRFDEDENEIDFLENESEVREGDFAEWDQFKNFYENNDFSDDAKFAELAQQLDPDHYRDYIVFNVFVDNTDWPGNNNRYWKKRDSDETWKWLTWDLDFSFGLFNLGQPFNGGYFQANSLGRLLRPQAFNWPNPRWATNLFNNMLENDQWRYDLINRMADQMNTLYTPARMNVRISEYENQYAPEIQEHHDRWSSGFQVWSQNVNKLRTFANGRPNVVRQQFVNEFNEISGTTSITVNLNPANRGEVAFSTINVAEATAPFNGTYFRGIPIPVQAFPNRGYILNSWSGALNGDNPLESLTVNGGSSSITANFILGSTSTQSIVINEINYNSPDSPNPNDWVELHNPNNSAVNISGWYFEDESGRFFGLPKNTIIPANGYLVLAEDLASFSAVYPGVSNVIGSFGQDPRGFGLSGGGELITLKNANGVLIDEVEYDDRSPWPTEPDGDGPTLQLISPSLDNALAASWNGTPATPGAINGTPTGPQDQTINFQAISDKNVNDGPFSVSATASSGLSVSFAIISGPATISGNTITLNGTTGTVRVRASQAGNGQWNPAPSVDRTFNVTSNPTNGDCDDITWTTTNNSITLSGINSGNYIVKLFSANYTTIYNVTNGTIPVTINNLANEVHHLDVQLYTANWQAICSLQEDITLGGGPATQISLSCPADISVQIPQGSTSMTVNYNLPTASTTCPSGGLSLVRTGGPVSGSTLTANNYIVNYQATDNCGNSENCSFNLTVLPAGITPPTGEYCTSASSQPWQEWVAGVQLGTIDNESGKCGPSGCGYSDYTNLSTSLSKGTDQNIRLTPGLSWNGYNPNLYWRVWIDLNGDGDFTDAGEQVLQANSGNQIHNGTINIPASATNGTTRMRVSVKKDGYAGPCESFTEGEVEDYTVDITGGGTPPTPPGDYCDAKADRPWQEWISGVTLGAINNSTGKCGPSVCGYGDYTELSATISAGSNPGITLTPGLSYPSYRPDLYWRVWIDLNQDGDFTDSGERVFQRFNNTGSVVNGNLNIPATASNGATRMRVIVSKNNYVGPCASFDQGEVEDYSVVITGGSGASNLVIAPGQEMLFLRGATTADGIQLNWSTNTEYKNDRFAIGRSYDGVNFTAINHKDALGAETTSAVQYQSYDTERLAPGIVYYQIQAIHTEGTSNFSNILEINNQQSEDRLLLYPNPAMDEVRVDLSSYAGEPANIQIHNAFGQPMITELVDELTTQPLRFDLQNLRAGTYSLTAKVGEYKRMSRILVVVKR